MNDELKLGYCTNVHAGVTISEVLANLKEHALPVKAALAPDKEMGVGLWLSATAAQEVVEQNRVAELSGWFQEHGLEPFTFNAFPFSDFHQSVVKHKVYHPTWASPERLKYTLDIALVQSELLGEGSHGSISTLPLGWPDDTSPDFLQACARNLVSCAESLAEIKERTGRSLVLCVEPEPGCIFDRSEQVVNYFDQYLLSGQKENDDRIREHIGVCHDICHAAVMGESQASAIANYSSNEIRIGKYQISAALRANFHNKSAFERSELIEELKLFAEDRYLHQTMVLDAAELVEDLPLAIRRYGREPTGIWNIHFHVPLFIAEFGNLETTQSEIGDALSGINKCNSYPMHFEIETYAWTVLPDELQEVTLSAGIVKEINYFQELLKEMSFLDQ